MENPSIDDDHHFLCWNPDKLYYRLPDHIFHTSSTAPIYKYFDRFLSKRGIECSSGDTDLPFSS